MQDFLVYIVSEDQSWTEQLQKGLAKEDITNLKACTGGMAMLAAFKEHLPDAAVIDLRGGSDELLTAVSVLSALLDKLASPGMLYVGRADPATQEAVNKEREYLNGLQGGAYLNRDTDQESVVRKIREFREERRRTREQGGRNAGSAGARGERRISEGDGSSLQVFSLFGEEETIGWVSEILAQVEVELRQMDPLSIRRGKAKTLDSLVVDSSGFVKYAAELRKLQEYRPGVRLLYLPEPDQESLSRLPNGVTSLIFWPDDRSNTRGLAQLIRQMVGNSGQRSVNGVEYSSSAAMVVEDEENIRDITARYLILQGYEVFQARDGSEALQVLEQWNRVNPKVS